MAYRVEAASEFVSQLDEAIAFRVEHYGLAVAEEIIKLADELNERLSVYPLLGRVLDDRASGDDDTALRWMKVGPYIAIYRFHSDKETVVLLKLFYAASNWRKRILKD